MTKLERTNQEPLTDHKIRIMAILMVMMIDQINHFIHS